MFTLGCDPEFFLFDKKNRQFVTAEGLLPGSKQAPHKLSNGGACLVDGQAVEFNIVPTTTPEEFKDRVVDTLLILRSMIDMRYRFVFNCSVKFGKKYYDNIPAEQKIVGCDPFLVDDKEILDEHLLRSYQVSPIKFAGGHIHIGWGSGFDKNDPSHREDCMFIANQVGVKMDRLDAMFGYGNFYDPKADHTRRYHIDLLDRKYPNPYKAFNAYRIKPYGVEARGFGPNWLRHPMFIEYTAKKMFQLLNDLFNYGEDRDRFDNDAPWKVSQANKFAQKDWVTEMYLAKLKENN